MRLRLLPGLMLLALSACHKTPKLTLADVADLNAVAQVQMSNDSGVFILTPKQLKQFKKELAPMPYAPGDFKDGSVDMTVRAGGKSFYFNGRTHGDVIGVAPDFITRHRDQLPEIGTGQKLVFFRTNGANLAAYFPDTTTARHR